MNQILNKIEKQKTKIKKDIRKVYYDKEKNEEQINKSKKEFKSFKKAIRNRKNKTKIYDYFSLRVSELKKSIIRYENYIIVLRDRITDFEGLRNNKKLKINIIKQNIKLMKTFRVRCHICKIDFHRASHSRYLKNKELLEILSQNKVIIL